MRTDKRKCAEGTGLSVQTAGRAEDERENERVKREEEHFRQIDELIRRKQEKGKRKSTHFSECFVSFAFKNDTYSSEIEPVGQAPAQEPQLMHLSGSI